MNRPTITNTQSSGSLLLDWPSTSQKKKYVAFSEYSTFHIYNCSSRYRANMSYSSIDIRRFFNRAMREGNRIKNLISQFPFNAGAVILGLVKNNIIDEEELLGIEHLIGQKTYEQLMDERRAHMMLVLSVQNHLRETNQSSEERLAHVAKVNSHKSTKKARVRALLAI